MDPNKQFENLNWGKLTIYDDELQGIQGIDIKTLKSKMWVYSEFFLFLPYTCFLVFVALFITISFSTQFVADIPFDIKQGHKQLTCISDLLVSYVSQCSSCPCVWAYPVGSPQLLWPCMYCICCIFSTHSCIHALLLVSVRGASLPYFLDR